MKKAYVSKLAMLLAAVIGAATIAGCGQSTESTTAPAAESETAEEAAEEAAATETADAAETTDEAGEAPADVEPEVEEYTWLISSATNTLMYDEYEENPIYKYWSFMVWDVDGTPNQISIDFSAPPAGAERDNINTLIATQEYPDVMAMAHSAVSAAQLYEEGIALDLTEYVDKYMPNYKAWMEAHPAEAKLMTNKVDGEDRIIQLFIVSDQPAEMWGGFDYRRDWIVKYGKNPETGEAFTGAWEDSENGETWVDDVVFPSGGEHPETITDWEWMLEIFDTALKEQGITDGYATSIPYNGFYQIGDLTSGFGVSPLWYMDEDGVVRFGGNTDEFRAYVECVSSWYEKGWLDPAFDERSGDMFFHVDDTGKYAGKVGMWYGVSSQMGSGMDVSDGDESNPTNGMVVYGCAQPINDKYGPKEAQGKTPTAFFGNSLIDNGVIITEKAQEKDIATLLTAIDFLYGQEGGLLRTFGFSDEQQAELQDEFYTQHHLDNGTYHVETNEDNETIYKIHNERDAEDELAQYAMMGRLVGLTVEKNVDRGYPAYKQSCMEEWARYANSGYLTGAVTGQLSADAAQRNSDISNQTVTFMSQAVADFVAGRRDVNDDADWEDYCTEMENYPTQEYCDALNAALGNE